MNRAAATSILLLLCLHIALSSSLKPEWSGSEMQKREIKQEWEDLGWAWGKRSDPSMVPRRFLRALHPVKKTPDWGDLGWTWGRK